MAAVAAGLQSGYLPTYDTANFTGFDVPVISVPTLLHDGAPDLPCIEDAGRTLAALHATMEPVVSPAEAELVKLFENTFRHVNIALVNELAMFAREVGVDVRRAIDATSTKPFGYMRFTPGPGVGGHCLPIHPYRRGRCSLRQRPAVLGPILRDSLLNRSAVEESCPNEISLRRAQRPIRLDPYHDHVGIGFVSTLVSFDVTHEDHSGQADIVRRIGEA